jgi:hypothetical protein
MFRNFIDGISKHLISVVIAFHELFDEFCYHISRAKSDVRHDCF